MTRIKSQPLTRDEFFAAIDQIATLQTRMRLVTARRDKQIQSVQDEFQPEISTLTEQIKARMALAEQYADTHRDELFPGKVKSAETELASYGYRLHPPALKLLNRKWSWDAVLEAAKRAFPGRFVRQEETLQKDSLKAELTDEQLGAVGLRIDQQETFGVTPKVEGAETESAA